MYIYVYIYIYMYVEGDTAKLVGYLFSPVLPYHIQKGAPIGLRQPLVDEAWRWGAIHGDKVNRPAACCIKLRHQHNIRTSI